MNEPLAPLFRDPIHDGAADPTLIWNRQERSWWLLYTNRRANVACRGVAWVRGLAVSAVTGPTVALYWNPNREEDLWGYRISYQPTGGGPASSTDVVRATQSSILLPRAGSWRITIAAYDAMGRLSPSSAAVTATTTSNASQVVVPLLRR